MASVRGPDPCLAAGSDPDCVTTNRVRDTTYVGTAPGWLPWPLWTTKRKNGQYWDREKKGQHQKKDTLAPKKVRIAFAFLLLLFAFFFTPFFYDFKGIKTKEKDKDKEKSESGSGHSWTDTDSGPGSGPLRSGF